MTKILTDPFSPTPVHKGCSSYIYLSFLFDSVIDECKEEDEECKEEEEGKEEVKAEVSIFYFFCYSLKHLKYFIICSLIKRNLRMLIKYNCVVSKISKSFKSYLILKIASFLLDMYSFTKFIWRTFRVALWVFR